MLLRKYYSYSSAAEKVIPCLYSHKYSLIGITSNVRDKTTVRIFYESPSIKIIGYRAGGGSGTASDYWFV